MKGSATTNPPTVNPQPVVPPIVPNPPTTGGGLPSPPVSNPTPTTATNPGTVITNAADPGSTVDQAGIDAEATAPDAIGSPASTLEGQTQAGPIVGGIIVALAAVGAFVAVVLRRRRGAGKNGFDPEAETWSVLGDDGETVNGKSKLYQFNWVMRVLPYVYDVTYETISRPDFDFELI